MDGESHRIEAPLVTAVHRKDRIAELFAHALRTPIPHYTSSDTGKNETKIGGSTGRSPECHHSNVTLSEYSAFRLHLQSDPRLYAMANDNINQPPPRGT